MKLYKFLGNRCSIIIKGTDIDENLFQKLEKMSENGLSAYSEDENIAASREITLQIEKRYPEYYREILNLSENGHVMPRYYAIMYRESRTIALAVMQGTNNVKKLFEDLIALVIDCQEAGDEEDIIMAYQAQISMTEKMLSKFIKLDEMEIMLQSSDSVMSYLCTQFDTSKYKRKQIRVASTENKEAFIRLYRTFHNISYLQYFYDKQYYVCFESPENKEEYNQIMGYLAGNDFKFHEGTEWVRLESQEKRISSTLLNNLF